MRIVPINEAEAIIEPFFTGSEMSNREGDPTLIDTYDHLIANGVIDGRIAEGWQAPVFAFSAAPIGTPILGIRKPIDLDISGYDRMMIFCNLPYHVELHIEIEIDGNSRKVIDGVIAEKDQREFEAPISGSHLTHINIYFVAQESREAEIELFWLGLANDHKRSAMLKRPSAYTAEWPLMIRSKPGPGTTRLELAFSADDIAALRERILHEPFKTFYAQLRERAETWRNRNPEDLISEYMERYDPRYHRGRNKDRKFDHRFLEVIALVGLIEDDIDMSRKAARIALSIVHCPYWTFTGFMDCFPGSPYHMRSFVEMELLHNLAFVLDWAGHVLTVYGRRVIENAIIMRGFSQLESDNHRHEYIWHCNQGIAFNYGYIAGLLSVLPEYPRYAKRLEECKRNLEESISNYVLPDGGTLEGCGYWIGTFHNVIPQYHLLSRHFKVTYREVVSDDFLRTLSFPHAMRTTEHDAWYLPINDSKGHRQVPRFLSAFALICTEDSRWAEIYRASVENSHDGVGEGEPSIWDVIIAPEPVLLNQATPDRSTFISLPDTGQVQVIKPHATLDRVLFHVVGGPTESAHTNQDKGSFILEAKREPLLIDRGVTVYNNPETNIMTRSGYHNLLCPLDDHGIPLKQYTSNSKGGVIESAVDTGDGFTIVCDNTNAWISDDISSSVRRYESIGMDDITITDSVKTLVDAIFSFRLHAYSPFVVTSAGYTMTGKRCTVTIVPKNWSPERIEAREMGIDYHETPVYMLAMNTAMIVEAELKTQIYIHNRG